MVIRNFLGNCFEATLSSRVNVLSIFQVFVYFWVAKLKSFSGKVRQSVQISLNQNSFTGSFLENGFEVTLSSKTNVVSVWIEHFSVFCKLLSDEVEIIFWKSETKRSRLFKSKFGHRKLIRKWFWSCLELKKKCSERLKKVIFQCFVNFRVTKLKPFFGKVRQSVKIYSYQNLGIWTFLENSFKATLSSKMNILSVWKGHFLVFCKFLEWRSWNQFLGKWGKAFKTI